MSFAVGETINNLADKLLSAPIISTTAKDPLYTALVITLIIVLIVMFTFRDAEMDKSLLSTSLGFGFYVFLFVTTALFLNNRILMKDSRDETRAGAVEHAFNGAYSGLVIPGSTAPLNDEIVPVQINTSFP